VNSADCGHSEPREPDLPKRPDVWVSSITFNADSRLQYVEKTKDHLITSVSAVKDLNAPRRISIGDEIDGIRVGAIRYIFFWTDASYGREQYMWRGTRVSASVMFQRR
jgi:hypothetical protein